MLARTAVAQHADPLLSIFSDDFGRPEGSWWDAPLVRAASGTILVNKGFAKYNATQIAELLAVVDVVVRLNSRADSAPEFSAA